jgi:putative colanic acid biosynthesis UDP-glucose lipid carrier transferase
MRRWPISCGSISAIAIISDIVIVVLSGIGSEIVYDVGLVGTTGASLHYVASAAVVAVLFVALMKSRDLYSPAELLALRNQILSIATAWTSVFLFLAGTAFAFKVSSNFSRISIFSFAVVGFLLLIIQRIVYRYILSRGLNGQRFSGRSAVLITDAASSDSGDLIPILLEHGFQLERQFVLPPDHQDPKKFEQFVTSVIGTLRGSNVEEVIIGADAERWTDLNRLLSSLRILPLPISLMPVGAALDILNRPTRVIGDSVCIELHRGPLDAFERGLKRFLDVLTAATGLILFFPLLALTAIAIKLDSPGPIFFRQKRLGFNGRPFPIIKFRTMSVLEDGPLVCQAAESDDRVTRVGRILRRSSIDELPQLLNVLNASMSLIGPRPHAVAHENQFQELVSNYASRQHVKPGLTGWAQVNGCRGPTPTVEHIRRRVEFDLWYIDNWSLRLDFMIIARTMIEVIRGRNAY